MTIDPGWPVAVACLLLLAMAVALYVLDGLPNPLQTVLAVARAVAQLGAAALVIVSVMGSLWLSVALLAVMFAVAVRTSVARLDAAHCWPAAAVAMAAGLVPVVAIVLATGTVPPSGAALIPVVGILLGNTMNGHTLVGRRCFDALRDERGQYEAALSVGLARSDAVALVIHRRVPEALIPGLDQIRTAGVVTLPGAFIGVMLGGGSPAQAAAAQVLVLVGILAAQTATAVAAERFIRAGRLMAQDLGAAIHP